MRIGYLKQYQKHIKLLRGSIWNSWLWRKCLQGTNASRTCALHETRSVEVVCLMDDLHVMIQSYQLHHHQIQPRYDLDYPWSSYWSDHPYQYYQCRCLRHLAQLQFILVLVPLLWQRLFVHPHHPKVLRRFALIMLRQSVLDYSFL